MSPQHHGLDPLLAPRSIAIIGASPQPGRIGGLPLVHLTPHPLNTYNRYEGAVYPVNPKYTEAFGLPCYASIEAVPQPVDLAVLAVPAAGVMEQLERCHRAGAKAAIVFASGYSETGLEDGAQRQQALKDFSERTGMPVAGPNCMGNANILSGAYSTFAGSALFATPDEGRISPDSGESVGLVTQSGNMCAVLYKLGQGLGVRYSHFINTGNESCVEFSQYLDYLLSQSEVNSVLGYVEQLRDGPAFLDVARRFRAHGKMLAILKSGRTSKGSEAAFSHTSALAGSHAAFEAACRETGVVIAEDLPHLALLGYLARFNKPVGRRIALVTMSGAAGALLSDALTDGGLELPTLNPMLQAELRALLPDYGMVSNPVDVTGNIQKSDATANSMYYRIMRALLASDDVDTVMLYMPGAYLDAMADDLVQAARESSKMLVVVNPSSAKKIGDLESAGIPHFGDMTRAALTLVSYAKWCAHDTRHASTPAPKQDPQQVLSMLALADGDALNEVQAKQLLAAIGLPVIAERVATSPAEAVAAAQALGYPAVVKVLSTDIAHKSEAGGVKIGLATAEAVEAAFHQVTGNARARYPQARVEAVVVQPMAGVAGSPAVELLVGVTRDPIFGPMLTVGLGGVWTELFGDVAHALLPIDPARAVGLLRSLKGFPLLDGFRGAPRADVDAAARVIAGIATLVELAGARIAELEVNPLMVMPQGKGAVVVDALVKLNRDAQP